MFGTAVKVTEVPAQMEPTGFVLIETDGTTTGLTVKTSVLLVAVAVVTQPRLEVMTTNTEFPLANVVVVYVAELEPTGLAKLFRYH